MDEQERAVEDGEKPAPLSAFTGNEGTDVTLTTSAEIKVSIICCTYNQEGFIRDALDGFLSQETNFRFEVLLHDDASTDGTQAICEEYALNHPDVIRFFSEEENQLSQGVKISRDILLPHALGKYIAVCEGDDYWTNPTKLQRQYDYMELHQDCSLYVHNADFFDCRVGAVTRDFSMRESGIVPMEEMILYWSFPTASMFYRKADILRKPREYDVCATGDEVTKLHLATCGYVYYSDEKMSVYRSMAKNSWSQRLTNFSAEAYARKLRYARTFQEFLDAFDKNTQGQYRDVVERRKARIRMNYYLEVCEYKKIRASSALDKEYQSYLAEVSSIKKVWHFLREAAQKTLGIDLVKKPSFPYFTFRSHPKQWIQEV